jgi:hypothetical protein
LDLHPPVLFNTGVELMAYSPCKSG